MCLQAHIGLHLLDWFKIKLENPYSPLLAAGSNNAVHLHGVSVGKFNLNFGFGLVAICANFKNHLCNRENHKNSSLVKIILVIVIL